MPKEPASAVVAPTEWDRTPMAYLEVQATDEDGTPIAAGGPKPYSAMVKAELEAEIERRNAGRDVASLLSAESTKNADLIAVLEADDAASTEENADGDN